MDTNDLVKKISEYGRKTIKIDGMEYEKTAFMGFRKMQRMIDFKVLDKGCETWIEGEKYPMRVFTDIIGNRQLQVARIKRLIPTITKTIKGPISLIYLWRNWRKYIDFMWFALQDVFMDCDRYNQPVREVYRVLSDKGIDKIRDIICAILEFDTAYRYRFQDIVGELKKDEFEKNPRSEVKRLLDLLFKRELSETNGMGKFKLVSPIILFWAYKLKPIVKELNIEEIRMSIEDKYWTSKNYEEFNFRGKTYEERLKEVY